MKRYCHVEEVLNAREYIQKTDETRHTAAHRFLTYRRPLGGTYKVKPLTTTI